MDVVEVDVWMAATPERAWQVFARDELRADWWPWLELDPRPGGRLVERWTDGDGREVLTSGRIELVQPPRRLVASWRDDDWPASTRVSIELAPAEPGILVRVRHEGWQALGADGAALAEAHAAGWRQHLADWRLQAEQG